MTGKLQKETNPREAQLSRPTCTQRKSGIPTFRLWTSRFLKRGVPSEKAFASSSQGKGRSAPDPQGTASKSTFDCVPTGSKEGESNPTETSEPKRPLVHVACPGFRPVASSTITDEHRNCETIGRWKPQMPMRIMSLASAYILYFRCLLLIHM